MNAEQSFNANGLAWAVSRWQAEVSQRPLANKHRRTLDDTWRQVICYFGGDPGKLIGPDHDTLLLQNARRVDAASSSEGKGVGNGS